MDRDSRDVLLTTFIHKRKNVRAIFDNNQIVWGNSTPPHDNHTVHVEDILSVECCYLHNGSIEAKVVDPHSFVIRYAKKVTNKLWKCATVKLTHSDHLQVSIWIKALQQRMQYFLERPKKLLIFINPLSGNKNALNIYEKHGKPLFQMVGIDVTVIMTQRKNQIRDYVLEYDLDSFNALICVGGDGTVSELLNGLVLRECKVRGVDANDISQDLPQPKIPIGIIPGGSTDTIIYCLQGSTDPTTAVLHIILGTTIGLDLVSVYDESKLLRLYASILSYGYLGDVADRSEKYRWMGPNRYNYIGCQNIMSNKGYEGEIAFYTELTDETRDKCYENCTICDPIESNPNSSSGVWKVVKGRFFMVNAANISCACSKSPCGIAPLAHLGDGNLELVLVRHTSVLNNLKLLFHLSHIDGLPEDLPFVERYSAKEFCFRATDIPGKWNCDGEVEPKAELRGKVRRQLIRVFSRGHPRPSEKTNVCCR